MRYLLDLPVIVETLRDRPAPGVLAWLARNAEAGFATASLVMAELETAVARMPVGGGRPYMAAWVRELQDSLSGAILPFDVAAAQVYARLRAQDPPGATDLASNIAALELAPLDALVAATAQAHGLILATRDAARFHSWAATAVDPWHG